MMKQTIFTDLAKSNNLVILFLNAKDGQWNDGRELGAGGYVVPVEKTLELWKTGNKCTQTRVDDIDINFSDESSVERESYKCEKGALSFFKINGGGHTIPGGKTRATLSNMVGNTNRYFY